MMILRSLKHILAILILGAFTKCTHSEECSTYDCRKKSFTITVEPSNITLGETTTLKVYRSKFNLPKFRVFIGEYDENFNLPAGSPDQYFDGTDSLATIALVPETAGPKKIRGIIEEYKFVTKDSIDSYRYHFEVEMMVKDSVR